jgi:hypothetical protein
MAENINGLKVKNGNRAYYLVCDQDAPIGDIYDALFHMQAVVIQKINESQEAHKAAVTDVTIEEIMKD